MQKIDVNGELSAFYALLLARLLAVLVWLRLVFLVFSGFFHLLSFMNMKVIK